MGVLGCALLSPNECMGECFEKLKGDGHEVFYDLRHQTIYETLAVMYDTREAIDVITLQQKLKDKQLLEQVGGIAYLAQLQDSVPSAANLSYYLEIIQEKYLLRRMISTCTDVVGRVYDYEGDVETLLDDVEKEILLSLIHIYETGRCGHAPSLSLLPKAKTPAPHRTIISVNAPSGRRNQKGDRKAKDSGTGNSRRSSESCADELNLASLIRLLNNQQLDGFAVRHKFKAKFRPGNDCFKPARLTCSRSRVRSSFIVSLIYLRSTEQ